MKHAHDASIANGLRQRLNAAYMEIEPRMRAYSAAIADVEKVITEQSVELQALAGELEQAKSDLETQTKRAESLQRQLDEAHAALADADEKLREIRERVAAGNVTT